jgi:hypothetical protein
MQSEGHNNPLKYSFIYNYVLKNGVMGHNNHLRLIHIEKAGSTIHSYNIMCLRIV